jgi:tetratricopeptide (TPR) repeat protein
MGFGRLLRGAAVGALALALVSSVWAQAAPGGGGSVEGGDAFAAERMRGIMATLAFVLPLSMDPNRFADPEHSAAVGGALRSMAERADDLESHGVERGSGFQHLAQVLARDVREADRRFRDGRIEEAAFLVQQLTENCLACHARLPSTSDTTMGQRLVEEMDLEGLTLPERARLQMATRQFSASLDTWEGIFASPDTTPAQLDRMGYLGDYLTLCIRVTGDPQRALATLRRLAQRPDTSDWVARDLAAWIDTLEELEKRGLESGDGSGLKIARSLLEEGDRVRERPADKTGLVYDLVASSLLYRYTESRPWGGPDVAEAYYLLGVAESRIDRSYWISQAEFYLETAIRMAPSAPFARAAYAYLKQMTLEGYTGSSGVHLPDDVRENLEALERLIDSSAAPAG